MPALFIMVIAISMAIDFWLVNAIKKKFNQMESILQRRCERLEQAQVLHNEAIKRLNAELSNLDGKIKSMQLNDSANDRLRKLIETRTDYLNTHFDFDKEVKDLK